MALFKAFNGLHLHFRQILAFIKMHNAQKYCGKTINQSRCRTRVTSVGDFINESLIDIVHKVLKGYGLLSWS